MLGPMNTDTTALDARLVALESKLTLAEDLLDQLNRTVFRQQEHLDALTRELVEMRRQQLAAGDAASGLPANERPPHY
ncbi:SlyX protein OS=Castellaniella defragrans OX=75697 GN=HNR28_001950 PE=4 SV=1 [Castellaniella defragrans]